MPSLPVDGQSAWGDVLNTYLNTLTTEANNTQTGLNNHAANNPSDPHGDRAYAQGLVNPITSGVNSPNGFVQLNSSGTIPASLISGSGSETGGMYSGIFDAVATYGAVAGSGSDQSGAIQNALNAANSAGGGLVWIGPGVFSLQNYLVIPSYTWLLMSEATVLSRIPGSINSRYLISNVQFGTSNTPSTNIRITGGKLDAVGANSMTSACTPVFIIQSAKTKIENIYINNVFSNPAIEINGCTNTHIDTCYFDGTGSNFGSSSTPAVRINQSASSTTPSGLGSFMYNNAVTVNIRVTNCNTETTGSTHGCYGALSGSDLNMPGYNDHIFTIGCSTQYASSLGNALYPNTNWDYSTSTGNLFYETAP